MMLSMMYAGLVMGLHCPASAVAASSPAPEVATAPAAPRMPVYCLHAFSKDGCDYPFYQGSIFETGCNSEDCKTRYVDGAVLKVDFVHNETGCDCGGKCDEVPEKDGTLKVELSYQLRLSRPCPYRGCMDGKGFWYARDGSVYEGAFMGTIGAGTHRCFTCPLYRHAFSEACWDVNFDACCTQEWRFGWEASFHGKRVDIDTGEEICISLSGDFYTPGTCDLPNLDDTWKTFVTADGVAKTLCN